MFQNFVLISVAIAAVMLSFWFNLKMFKLKRINTRIPAMFLNVLTCVFVTEFVVLVNDASLLKSWCFCNLVIAALVWIIYICGKYFRIRR